MAPAHFRGEMPVLCCALTATEPGTGESRPACIHPCVRTPFATNLETRATLHDYHPEGDAVNTDASGSGGKRTTSAGFLAKFAAVIPWRGLRYCEPSAAIDTRTSS